MRSGRVTLLADADRGAGLGHLARCSALGAALVERGLLVRSLAWGAEAPFELDGQGWEPVGARDPLDTAVSGAVLVLDTYHQGRARRARAAGPQRTVLMLDEGTPPPETDLVVGLPAWRPPAGGQALTGLRHACLRREYWAVPPRSVAGRARRVLVTTGGTDPGDVGGALAAALAAGLADLEVTLIRGPAATRSAPSGVTLLHAPNSLRAPLEQADVAVTAAGQSMLEALALGTPSVVLVLAENQLPGARLVAERELAIVIDRPRPTAVVAAVRRLVDDPDERSRQARLAQGAVDGRGALRVADAVALLAGA